MEYQFTKTEFPCMENLFTQTQTVEQTAQIRLPQQLDPGGRIIGAWGQPLLRTKEWLSGELRVSAGLMVWVLYQSDEVEPPVCLDTWIPVSFRWDLPRDGGEGKARISCLCCGVDARPSSVGKILVRGVMAAQAEGWADVAPEIAQNEDVPEGVELLRSEYPMRAAVEAGERIFDLEETVSFPQDAEKLLLCRMYPVVTESKVMAGKLVFRGNAMVHALYADREGRLHSWDWELPLSQYVQLERPVSGEAGASVQCAVTSMEAERTSEGELRLTAQLTGQYVVEDQRRVCLTEDAYLPGGAVQVNREELEIPAILDNHIRNFSGEQTVAAEGESIVEAAVLPEFPRIRRMADGVTVELSGQCQVLYYDGNGRLQCASHRWEDAQPLTADSSARILTQPGCSDCQVSVSPGAFSVEHRVSVEVKSLSGEAIPMVTALEWEENRKPDPDRPSLILRRAEGRLWDLAKRNGSTVEAIRRANGLENDPAPGQMLLIPVV